MSEGYLAPGIWIRIQHRFGPRTTEWFYSAHVMFFGVVLLPPSQTFNQPAFMSFREWISEGFLGWLMLLVGSLRVVGLIINGTRKHVTPQIRQFTAAVSFIT